MWKAAESRASVIAFDFEGAGLKIVVNFTPFIFFSFLPELAREVR